MPSISLHPQFEQLARAGAYVAFSVSGGKDGNIAGLVVNDALDRMGHPRERRVFIHADLGIIEWLDSLRMCREVANQAGIPLWVVKHSTHDMIGRWRQRFQLSLKRYANLEIVNLIAPWSSPDKRFCTNELKTAVIAAELVKWAGKNATIISVVGIRGDESVKRARQPVWQGDEKLCRVSFNLKGFLYRPIHAWTLNDVYEAHRAHGLRLHEAYTKYGSTRVSCAYCIMGSGPDLAASASNPENVESYRLVVELEMDSGFSFQGNLWLGDVRPDLLPAGSANRLAMAKAKRANRGRLEAMIPKVMLYQKGWPTFVPSLQQCELLGSVRRQVCQMYGVDSPYLSAVAIRARYQELFDLKRAGEQKADAKKARKAARLARLGLAPLPSPPPPQPELLLVP